MADILSNEVDDIPGRGRSLERLTFGRVVLSWRINHARDHLLDGRADVAIACQRTDDVMRQQHAEFGRTAYHQGLLLRALKPEAEFLPDTSKSISRQLDAFETPLHLVQRTRRYWSGVQLRTATLEAAVRLLSRLERHTD